MFKYLSNQNLSKICISFAILLLLSGCEEHYCIKSEDPSGLREKLDIVSTKQKWVNSTVYISDEIRSVTEINIVPSKINFCPKQYVDFAIRPGINDVILPFALKADDFISFSVIGSKICQDKKDNTKIRYVNIDEKCNQEEEEYFAHILNQNECQKHNRGYKDRENQYIICPNKYVTGNSNWLNGKEYWNQESLKSDQNEEKIQDIIHSIRQGQNINCNGLLSNQKYEMDTRTLNLLCGHICESSFGIENTDCVYIEFNNIKDDIFKSFNTENISKILKEKQVKNNITLLKINMNNENFKYLSESGIYTNYAYKINNNHPVAKLTFELGNSNDKGGFNIRILRIPNLKNDLYIHISDKFPEHNPGDAQEDISININQVHDIQYIEGLKEKLKNKIGTIYYGIRDHGCNYKNEGQFNIKLTTKELPTKTFSAIYNFFDEKVKTAFFGSSYKNANTISSNISPMKSLYQSFVASNKTNTIRSTIVSLLVLYIILYALYYFFGLTHVSIYEFLIICIKIGIIIQLLRDNSWNFFYSNAFSIFVNTPKQLIEIANFRGTTSNVFEFLDLPLNRFFSPHSVLLIVSLIFSGPFGIVSFCLVIWGLITISLSIFNALFSFIVSIAIVALLLSLTPIFIICLLFRYTRQMFHNWIRNLARFAIHPVILLIFISLISQVMDYVVYSVFNFEVCKTCILHLNLEIFKPCIFYGYSSKYTPNITSIIAFVILGNAMKALVEASSTISDSLFSIYTANEPGKQYQQSLMGIIGLDEQSVQRRLGQRSIIISSSQKPQIPQQNQRSKIPTNIGNQ